MSTLKPYGLMADLHLHGWQAFSGVNEEGTNTRLVALHGEIRRCAQEVKGAGGDTVYVAGDVFHVRGSIAPSVLNPTLDLFREIKEMGIEVVIIPGNHDLEGKHTTRLGSSVTALEGAGCRIVNHAEMLADRGVFMIPWHESIEALMEDLRSIKPEDRAGIDVMIHAPIDGTLMGIPNHGLSPEELGSLGYRRIFAGHYHHHKDFGNGVFSIGALAHHTWSDVRSKAGFLIVHPLRVDWRASLIPSFIDLDDAADKEEAELMIPGNYVRARVTDASMKEVEKAREWINECGAKGCVVQVIKSASKERSSEVRYSVSTGASIEESISAFVKSASFRNEDKVQIECQRILAKANAS